MSRTPMLATCLSAVVVSTGVFATGGATAQDASAVDPAATAAVDRMSAYLATLTSFEVTTDASRDIALDDGPTVKLNLRTRYLARLPDGLFAQVRTDRQFRDFYFDGRTLTLTAPRLGYYGSVSASGTVGELITTMSDTYGVDLPLADMFLWNARKAEIQPTAAMVVGYADVDGRETDQYVFSGPAAEWQIWIQRGDQPLPLRMVVTDTTDPARPQFVADLTWDLSPPIDAGHFTFIPPTAAKPIAVAAVGSEEADQ